MAKYDYQCSECKNVIELERHVSEVDDPVSCEYCHRLMKHVILQAPGVVWGPEFHLAQQNGWGRT